MSQLPASLPHSIASSESARARRFSKATLIGAIVLASLGWLIMAAVRPAAGRSELLVGLFLGTIFGQVTASAAWLPLGPLRFPLRIGLACAWLAATLIALAINISLDRAQLEELVVVSLGVGVQ